VYDVLGDRAAATPPRSIRLAAPATTSPDRLIDLR
jgi:hypothetical protein